VTLACNRRARRIGMEKLAPCANASADLCHITRKDQPRRSGDRVLEKILDESTIDLKRNQDGARRQKTGGRAQAG
jgi:hypothetical protein